MFTRALASFAPWREMQRLQDEMRRVLGDEFSAPRGEYPAVNAYLSENEAVVAAEVPGIAPDKLDISVHEDSLTIKGARPAEELKDSEVLHRRERFAGAFSRTLTLPFRVEAGKVTARYDRGILTITLPRAEEDKPRKIAIKCA